MSIDHVSVRIFMAYAMIIRADACVEQHVQSLSVMHRIAYALLKGIITLALDDLVRGQ